MALTDVERQELEGAIQALGGDLESFTFQEFFTNPTKYAGNTELRLIQLDLASNDTADVIKQNVISTLQEFTAKEVEIKYDSGGNPYVGAKDSRVIPRLDAAGNPAFDEDGNPITTSVKEGRFFPTANFADSFIATINQDQNALQAIQTAAINAGVITVEELGNEVNGIGGVITNALINQTLQYIDTSYNKWYPGSIERTNFESLVDESRGSTEFRTDINSFYGGIQLDPQIPLSTKYITSKEIFANGLLSFLENQADLAEAEENKFNVERALQIKSENIMPSMTTLAEDFEDYYQQLNGRPISDDLKAEFIDSVAKDWSPYVDALIAQDKFMRADDVMKQYTGTEAWQKMGFDSPQMGGYVTFEELRPEFDVQNPIAVVQDKIEDKAEAQNKISEEAKRIADAQYAYNKYLGG